VVLAVSGQAIINLRVDSMNLETSHVLPHDSHQIEHSLLVQYACSWENFADEVLFR
jgi:hypothetical protein